MKYIAVISEGTGEYSEKHSRFLGFIIPCRTEAEAAMLIAEKRKKYWDARHIVYAYVLADGTARFSDDGEPHGTAGKPVLEILQSSGIQNALITVVRYFGGILLGTGGLVRAYTAAAKEAVENCETAKVALGDRFSVIIDYADYDKFVFLLNGFNAQIEKSDFSERVKIEFTVNESKSADCLSRINDAFSLPIEPEFIEKTEISEKIQ